MTSTRNHKYSRAHRMQPVTSLLLVILLLLIGATLTACDLGRKEENAAPVQLEPYQPQNGAVMAQENASQAQDEAGSGEELPVETAANEAVSEVTAPRQPSSGVMGRYTAEILPVDQVPVLPEVAGQILEFDLRVGDQVQKDDVVVRIESSIYDAQRAQALAGLQAAQAQLNLLNEGADEKDIEAARAAVTAAEEGYQRALEGPTAEDLTMAEAQLRQAEAAVKRAQAAYDQVSWNPLIAALPESMQLEAATLSLEAAKAQYEKLVKGATDDVITAGYAQLAGARAQLQALEEGAKPAQIDAAQAQVNQAETVLYLAQLQVDKTQVRAPIDGTVASVNSAKGSMAAPGSPVAVILSPDVEIAMAVEEAQLSNLWVGQLASIRVDAYPGQEFSGEVSIIAPTLDPATRTVQVTIRPQDDSRSLLPGMFATVELQN